MILHRILMVMFMKIEDDRYRNDRDSNPNVVDTVRHLVRQQMDNVVGGDDSDSSESSGNIK